MAITDTPFLSIEAKGSIGNIITARRAHSRFILSRKSSPSFQNSPQQQQSLNERQIIIRDKDIYHYPGYDPQSFVLLTKYLHAKTNPILTYCNTVYANFKHTPTLPNVTYCIGDFGNFVTIYFDNPITHADPTIPITVKVFRSDDSKTFNFIDSFPITDNWIQVPWTIIPLQFVARYYCFYENRILGVPITPYWEE